MRHPCCRKPRVSAHAPVQRPKMAAASEADLALATVAVDTLLENLGLSVHLYAVEPRMGKWAVIVECATESGWQRVVLQRCPHLQRQQTPHHLLSRLGWSVARRGSSGWRLLVLRACRNWDFPKGMVEPGETPLDAAIRETAEEAGISDLAFRWGEGCCETEPYRQDKVAR